MATIAPWCFSTYAFHAAIPSRSFARRSASGSEYWSDLLWVIGDVHVVQMKVAKGALYFETIPADGIAMRGARNKHHIMSSRGYSRAEISSHGTGCHDSDPHVSPPRVVFASLKS
jgi:hypothetical protein